MADSVKIRITGDDKEFQNTLSGIGQKAGSVFKGMMASQIVTKGISMLTNGLRSAINTGMQFEAAMSQVAAISGATGQELEMLTETAKHYGETTQFSASQAAEALNYMALAGWDAQLSVDALGGVLDLAAASGMDLGAASDAVTDYLSAFSMEASQAGYMADLMAYAQSKSNTTASMLADAYGNCASSMHAAGQDIETTTAMLMALANQGIKGSEAGTQMAAVMRDLTQKMDNGQIMIGKTAVKVTDAAGNFRDLNDIIVDVGKATEGLGTAEQSAAIMETFTARSVKAVQTLLNEGMDSVNAYEDALRGSAGTAAEQAETMMDNLQGDVQIFQSALEGLQITASESTNGIARSITQEATGILNALNEAGKAGGLEGMADAAIAQIPKLLPKVVRGAEGLMKGLSARMPGLVQGLIAQLPDMLGSMGTLAPVLTDALTDAMSAAVEGVISNLPTILPALVQGAGKVLLSAGGGLMRLVDSVFEGIDTAMMKTGLRKMRLDEVIQAQLDSVDAERVKKLSGSIEAEYTFGPVTIDTEAFTTALSGAIETIQGAIDGIEGLTEQEKLRIKAAILSGSGYDALVEALEAMEVPDAADKALQIWLAVTTLTSAIGGLNLPQEAIDEIYTSLSEGGDSATIAAILESYGVDPEVSGPAAESITAAAGQVSDAVGDIGIDPAALFKAGVGAMLGRAAIVTLLQSYGVDEGTASAAADSITGEVDRIRTAIDGLNLPKEAVDEIYKALDAGATSAEIQAILESYKVDTDAASAAAASITAASDSINGAVGDIGVSAGTIAKVWLTAGADKALIATALKVLGLEESDYQSVLDSYDTARDTLSSKLSGAFEELKASLTNGIPDKSDPAFETAKQKVRDFFDQAYAVVDEWEASKIRDLEESGLTGTDLTTAIQNVKTEAQGMRDELNTLSTDADAWVEANAGAAGSVVREHFDELEALVQMVFGLDAKIAELQGSLSTAGETNRRAVEQGLVTDQKRQIEAIKYTSQEYEHAMNVAKDKAARALEELGEAYAGASTDAELKEYAERRGKIVDQLATEEEAAWSNYDDHMQKIRDSVFANTPEMVAALEQYGQDQQLAEAAQKLKKGIANAVNAAAMDPEGKIDPTTWFAGNAGMTDADYVAIADGLGIDPTVLQEKIAAALKNNGESELFTGDDFKSLLDFNQPLADALSDIDMTGAFETIEAGLTDEAGNINLDEANRLITEGMKSIGESVPQGMTTGIESGSGQAASAAMTMSGDVVTAAGEGVGYGSPAEKVIPIGESVPQGMQVGIENGTGEATAAATAMSQAVVNSAKSGMSDMSSTGRSLASGLAIGILSGRSSVVNAAAALASAAVSAVRSALGIHSPSRVMMEAGRFTGEGFSIGLQDSLRDAVRSAQTVIGFVNLRPRTDFSAISGDISGLADALGDAVTDMADIEGERPVILQVNGRELARTTSEDNARASARLNRSISLGVGK